MSIKKVVVTYDFSDEPYREFMKRSDNSGLDFVHYDNIGANHYDQMLFSQLALNRIQVISISYNAGDTIDNKLLEISTELESADLIFHDSPRVAYNVEDEAIREGLQKSVETLVQSRFLDKSSFLKRDSSFASKEEAKKIIEATDIPMPKSWSVDEYFTSERTLPVILKANWSSCGKGIFYFDRPEQMDIFWDMDLYQDVGVWTLSKPKKENYLVQDFIETPSNHFTHYRVFATGDGNILGAVLSVSGNRKDQMEVDSRPGPYMGGNIYNCVDSPTYLGCKKVISNHAQGGSQIAFDANGKSKPLTDNDREVLIAHGYVPEDITLNPRLKQLANGVAKLFSQHGIVYAGQDWMQDKNGNFYFIELNEVPGMEIFNTLYNKDQGDDKTAMEIGTRKLAEALANYQK